MKRIRRFLHMCGAYMLVATVVFFAEALAWWATVYYTCWHPDIVAGTLSFAAAIALVPAAYLVGIQLATCGIVEESKQLFRPRKEETDDSRGQPIYSD